MLNSPYIKPIQDSLLKAFAAIRSKVKVKELEKILSTYGIEVAYLYITRLNISGIIDKHITDSINEAILSSGKKTMSSIPAKAILKSFLKDEPGAESFRFNLLAYNASQFISNYQFSLIKDISQTSIDAIRQSLYTDMLAGVNPISTARNFRDAIGLTARQEKAVRNFERMLREGDMGALSRLLRDKRFDPTILNTFRSGRSLSESQIVAMTKRYRERYLKYRAETIARTEALRAISMGQHLSLMQAHEQGIIDNGLRRVWIPARDSRTRPAHRSVNSLNLDGVQVNQPFQTELGPLMYPRDPNGSGANTINCLHPDSVVNFATPKKLMRRWYEGDMITIKTHGGHKLTVTPNHPILWEHGWIAANAVKKTDRIIGGCLSDIEMFNLDVKNTDVTVEQFFNSFKISGRVVREVDTVVDFHGEATEQDIDIICFDSGLRNSGKAFVCDPFKKFRFSFSNKLFVFKTGSRSFFKCLFILNRFKTFIFNYFVGCFDLVCSLFLRHLRPFKIFSFALCFVSNFVDFKNSIYSTFAKSSSFKNLVYRMFFVKKGNNFCKSMFVFLFKSIFKCFGWGSSDIFKNGIKTTLRDIKKLLNFKWGHSFKVQLFDVVDIHKFQYSGYVYNLEDDKSYYICNGVINKNCRCAVAYKMKE